MSPSSGRRRRQNGPCVSLHLRWTLLALLSFNLVLWVMIIAAVRRLFS